MHGAAPARHRGETTRARHNVRHHATVGGERGDSRRQLALRVHTQGASCAPHSVCACVRVCVHACIRVCVRESLFVFKHVCVCGCARAAEWHALRGRRGQFGHQSCGGQGRGVLLHGARATRASSCVSCPCACLHVQVCMRVRAPCRGCRRSVHSHWSPCLRARQWDVTPGRRSRPLPSCFSSSSICLAPSSRTGS